MSTRHMRTLWKESKLWHSVVVGGPDGKLLHSPRVEVKAGHKEQWEQTGKRALPSGCQAARSAPTKPPFLSSKASASPTPSHACIL